MKTSLSILALLAGAALTTTALADSSVGFFPVEPGVDGGTDGAPLSWAQLINAFVDDDPSNPEPPRWPPIPAGTDAISLAFAMSTGNGGVVPDPTIPVIDPEVLFAAAGQCSATVSCTDGPTGHSCTVSVTCPLGVVAAIAPDGVGPRDFPKWPPPYYSEIATIGLDYPGLPVGPSWDSPVRGRSGLSAIIAADCVYDSGTFSPGSTHHGQICGVDDMWH